MPYALILVLGTAFAGGLDQDFDGFTDDTDCNDHHPGIFPGAEEIVGDSIDQDCNAVDACYEDIDRDGFGAAIVDDNDLNCDNDSADTSSQPDDCDDTDPEVNPEGIEICDGIDNNCRAGADEDAAIDVTTWFEDADGDGYGNRNIQEESCSPPLEDGPWIPAGRPFDLDDSDATIGPTAPGCQHIPAPSWLFLVPLAFCARRSRPGRP